MIFIVRYGLAYIWNPNERENRKEHDPRVKVLTNMIVSIVVIFVAWCIVKASGVLLLDILKWDIKMYGVLAIICETWGFINFGDLSQIDKWIEEHDKEETDGNKE